MNTLKGSSQQQIAAIWNELLPPLCFVSCGEIQGAYPALSKIERKSFNQDISQLRLTELEAGRHHAKNVLSKLNVMGVDLPKSTSSAAPQWPGGIKGCITHTRNNDLSHIAAVATHSKSINAIGIDAEIFSDLDPNLWLTFIRKDELDWLLTLRSNIRISIAKKVWCMKEAAIKTFGRGDMLSFSVYPNTGNAFNEFKLINHHETEGTIITARATEIDKITLAVVFT